MDILLTRYNIEFSSINQQKSQCPIKREQICTKSCQKKKKKVKMALKQDCFLNVYETYLNYGVTVAILIL